MKKLIIILCLICLPAMAMHKHEKTEAGVDGWSFTYHYLLNGKPVKLQFFVHECKPGSPLRCSANKADARKIADTDAQWEETHYFPTIKTAPTPGEVESK